MFSPRRVRPRSFRLHLTSSCSSTPRRAIASKSTRPSQPSPPPPSLRPRPFPTGGFEVIPRSVKVEEERLPFYSPDIFYPVHLGQVLAGRYQVVTKLGYGTTSTTWLGRDLSSPHGDGDGSGAPKFVTLKVHVNTLHHNQELHVYRHLQSLPASDHAGQQSIRMLQDSFQLQGPNGVHRVFVLPPLGISLRALQESTPGELFNQAFARDLLQQSIPALDFLHTDANITHTDFHAGNLLVGIGDESQLVECEEAEFRRPSARKAVGSGATIYASSLLLTGAGRLHLCDFGEARVGSHHSGLAMPISYRAPEIILGMEWGHSVDMWSVGLAAWDLLEPQSLFHVYESEDQETNEMLHLATMVALLGPPPVEFLSRSEKSSKYWDAYGNWIGGVPIPTDRTLESLEHSLKGDEKAKFLDFIRALLRWLPEERLTTGEAYLHPWIADGN